MITVFRDHITEELTELVKAAEQRQKIPQCEDTHVAGEGPCDSEAKYFCLTCELKEAQKCWFHAVLCVLSSHQVIEISKAVLA